LQQPSGAWLGPSCLNFASTEDPLDGHNGPFLSRALDHNVQPIASFNFEHNIAGKFLPHLILDFEVFLEELFVVHGVGYVRVADGTLAKGDLDVAFDCGVEHQVKVIGGAQLDGELPVEGQVDNLAVVDPDREDDVFIVVVGDREVVVLL
jgi:hypothetical protein